MRVLLGASPRSNAEVTLEANPGAIVATKFASFREAGVTRLSLGIQSFDDTKLKSLGSIHSSDEAKRAATSKPPSPSAPAISRPTT